MTVTKFEEIRPWKRKSRIWQHFGPEVCTGLAVHWFTPLAQLLAYPLPYRRGIEIYLFVAIHGFFSMILAG